MITLFMLFVCLRGRSIYLQGQLELLQCLVITQTNRHTHTHTNTHSRPTCLSRAGFSYLVLSHVLSYVILYACCDIEHTQAGLAALSWRLLSNLLCVISV